MSGDSSNDDTDATRTSIGAATLLKKDRLLANRYRIVSPIGAGGMGLVYRAHDERLDIDVAIKVLRPERAPDKSMLERFERELVLAREVSHPNVVRIHDIGQDGDLHFITMDLVEGRSLRDLIEDGEPLSAERAVEIAADIAGGLDAAHRKGVIHRDLKPANILIDAQGQAFISDFGVARSLHAANLTVTGMIVGSPDYLAPEQARGGDVDGRTDIYALGLMLYEMLSGELPFRSGTIEELIVQRTTSTARDLATTGAAVPPWLRRVVNRCLQIDPADRFATAGELAESLRAGRAPRALWSKTVRRGIAGLAVAAVVSMAAVFGSRFLPTAGNAETLRLAVLPMANDTGQPELQWLASGIGDMLATRFAETPGIELIETSRIDDTLADLKLEPTNLDNRELSQLAELLSADRVLTGAVRLAGEGLRIDARLRRADGSRARSIEAVAAQESPHELITDLAERVTRSLAISAPISESLAMSSSAKALEAYTLGRAALRQADTTTAIPLLKEAVATDPGFAAAWLYLADAYDLAGYVDLAKSAIRSAADQNSAENSRTTLRIGALRAALDGDYDKSRTLLAGLIERFPSDIPSRMALAEAYGDEGLFDDANAILDSVVEVDDNHPRAWFLLGKYAIQSGDSRRAIDDYLVRDLVIQNRLDNDFGRANVLNAMGIAYDRLGRTDNARENYERAAALRGKIGDRRGMATSLNNLARLEMMSGNFDAARASLEQARQVSIDIGDQAGLAAFTNTVGTLEEEVGNYSAALDAFREALRIREKLGDRRALTESYNNVGFAYYVLGELDNAKLYWDRALAEARELGNRDGEMLALQSLGLLYMARGAWGEAQKVFVEALSIGRELDYPEAEAVSVGNIGQIAALQGRYSAALERLEEALRILEPVGDTRGLTEFGLHRADVLTRLGMTEEARKQLDEVDLWLGAAANPEQRAELLRIRALMAADDPQRARELLLQAIETAQRSGSVAAQMKIRLTLANQAMDANDSRTALDEARSVAEQARSGGYDPIRMSALLIQTRAAAALHEDAAARSAVDDMQRLLDGEERYADAYLIHAASADVFAKDGQSEAALRQRTLAREEIARLRDNMPAPAIGFFEAGSEVARLRNEALVDGE